MRRDATRRTLLRLLATAPVAVPLLEIREARAQQVPPRRLVILQWTNGVVQEFWPALPIGGAPYALTDALAPLAPHQADLLLLGGLKLDPALRTGHWSLPMLLTGQSARRQVRGAPLADSISIDQHVAEALWRHQPRPLKSLELAANHVNSSDLHRSMSFRGPSVNERPADNPPEFDSYRVWRRLFGGSGTQPGTAIGDHLVRLTRQRRSVLDYLGRDLTTLASGVGRADRARLQAHLESVRHLEAQLAPDVDSGHAIPACAPVAPAAGVPMRDPTQIDRQVSLQLDLLVLALRCDLTRVATMMMTDAANNGITFPFLGPEFDGDPAPEGEFDHHGIAHRGGPRKARVDRWWITQLAAFLDRLKNVPEGAGTLLDRTLVLFANNMAHGATHKVEGLPWILAGSGGGYFKTGRYVAPPGWDPAKPQLACVPHNGVLIAVGNAMLQGIADPLTTFGDPTFGGELTLLRG